MNNEKLDTRGSYNKCQKCKYKFKFYYRIEKDTFNNSNYPCPSCGELFCTKPKHERKLFKIQLKYRGIDDETFYKLIFPELIPYTKSLFLKFYRKKIDSLTEDVDYYVTNAVSFLIEEYVVDPSFIIDASFGGYLNFKIKQALYNKHEKGDIHGISLDYQFEDNNYIEYEDKKNSIISSIEDQEDKINLCEYLYKLIIGYNVRISEEEDIIRLLAVYHSLKKGEKYSDKLFRNEIMEDGKIVQYKTFNKTGKVSFLDTMDILKRELIELGKNE